MRYFNVKRVKSIKERKEANLSFESFVAHESCKVVCEAGAAYLWSLLEMIKMLEFEFVGKFQEILKKFSNKNDKEIFW